MVKIVLPTMAAYIDDVETMLSLLERTVDRNRYEIGLEIVGKPEHFQEERYLDQIRENIISVAKGAYLVVHGFSGMVVYESGMGDMRTDKGREHLETLLNLGKDIKAAYIHVHSNAGYTGERLEPPKKICELDKIRRNLLDFEHKLSKGCRLGIENLPSPSMGDYPSGSEDIWRDCVDSIEDCLYIVKGTELKVTLDTCHYAANMKGSIDLVEPGEELGEYLYYLHLNDVSGFWKPNESVWKEGVVPGDGEIGEDPFKDFIAYVKDKHPDIGLCLEVHNADFKNPVESEESIKRVLKWLRQ